MTQSLSATDKNTDASLAPKDQQQEAPGHSKSARARSARRRRVISSWSTMYFSTLGHVIPARSVVIVLPALDKTSSAVTLVAWMEIKNLAPRDTRGKSISCSRHKSSTGTSDLGTIGKDKYAVHSSSKGSGTPGPKQRSGGAPPADTLAAPPSVLSTCTPCRAKTCTHGTLRGAQALVGGCAAVSIHPLWLSYRR